MKQNYGIRITEKGIRYWMKTVMRREIMTVVMVLLFLFSLLYRQAKGMPTSLLYLKNAWAAAFAPVVNVAAPYISRFIDMIAGALNAVGQFTAALTGKGRVVQAKKAWYN